MISLIMLEVGEKSLRKKNTFTHIMNTAMDARGRHIIGSRSVKSQPTKARFKQTEMIFTQFQKLRKWSSFSW
jgi:hypothetical protein